MKRLGSGVLAVVVALAVAAPSALAQGSAQDEYVESLPGPTGSQSQKRGGGVRTAERDGSPSASASGRKGGGSAAGDEALLDEIVGATAAAGPVKAKDRKQRDAGPSATAGPPSYGSGSPSLQSTVAGAVSDPGDPILWLILFGLASVAAAAFVHLRRRRSAATSVE